ncbi:MAG TPA: adenosine deaminase [Thermoanaerobaculia bacterium]|nr:adenosine deaminase [Thermoanaerobaculia bacterium]
MSLESFLLRMPKAELHVHLEGSIRPATLLALARRHGVALPADDEAGLREWFRFRDFEHFVEIYLAVSSCLRDAEDFHALALDFLAEQARQNVLYTEAHFTISTHVAEGADGDAVAAALADAIAEGERRFGVVLRLIPDIVRNMPVERADVTLEWALANRRRGVVAMGLAGIEAQFPNEPFAEHFARAEREGLHRVAHAGEHAGPESIRSALEVARAERIGHGVRAAEDTALVEELARRGVPLEVCPTSNLCLGVYPSLPAHSFGRLYAAGVRVTVNSDDPPFFDTTLTDEYRKVGETWGYGPAELAGLSLAGVAHSFLPEADKPGWEARFRRAFAELGEELLGEAVEPVLPPGELNDSAQGAAH